MICAAFVNAISQVILKKCADKTKDLKFFQKFLNKSVLFAYCLFGIVVVINLFAYRGVDFKYGGAINAIGQIFVLILSFFICKERISKNRIIGSTLIIVGVVIYSLQ